MRYVSLALALVVVTLTLSDIIHARGLRLWKAGRSQQGMEMLKTSAWLNPLSMDIRIDQIESLFTGYKLTRNIEYLKETELLGRDLMRLYPGSVQARSVYAMTLIYSSVHGGDPYYPITEALQAVESDPLSVATLERAMLLVSSKRGNYATFKTLGVARSRLTRDGIVMRCALCGRHWLEHK